MPELNTDIRIMIWKLCYLDEPPRIVEIETKNYLGCENTEHNQAWYRYSPSPPPAVANICRESRQEALRIAHSFGHILFTYQPNGVIYFDSEKDTLYVRNDKEYWIRDFWQGAGTLAQLRQPDWKPSWQPEMLRFLAIELDPIERATSHQMFIDDLRCFPNLEQVVFVVAKPDEKFRRLAETLSAQPRSMNRSVESMRRMFGGTINSGWLEVPNGTLIRRSELRKCALAVRRGVRFEFVSEYHCQES